LAPHSRLAEDSRLIEELAGAVLDGTPVNWPATADPSAGRLLDHLRVAAAVADLHRTSTGLTSHPAASARRVLPVPESWGHLRILDRIGRGAFGDVYRAWDSRLDRHVALKLIHAPARAAGEPFPSSIIREGRLLARVRHPNVAMIHGAEQIGDCIGLWMELVQGRTLEESLRAGATFSPEQVTQIGIELARAVAAVHAAGLLHRDIKAQNVMQSADGRIVLMDFGTGRELVDDATDLAGTPLCLAPEVFRGEPASVQSDVYSLGVVLYHLLTDAYPVKGRTVTEVRTAHEQHDRIDLQSRRADVSIGLARVIRKAIDPDPAARYDSAEALSKALEQLARPARARGRWIGYVAAAALGIALVAGVQGFVAGHGAAAVSSLALRASETPTIAVLPFASFSADPDSQLIAEGLTSEIAHYLGAIEGLTVVALTGSPGAQRSPVDIRAIGRERNVNLVLTGSVLVSGGQLRVNADLIRVADLAYVWTTDTLTEDGHNVVATHEDLSLLIVNRLRLQVGQGQRRYRLDPDMEPVFLKAQGLLARRRTDNAGKAAQLFEQVIARDATYAPALAGLGSALGAFSRATQGDAAPPPNPRMEQAARQAFHLDPLLPEAQAAMGSLHARDREWRASDSMFREALKRNPNLTTTYTEFVLWVLGPTGRLAEALHLLEQARVADPDSLDVRRVMALVQVDSGLYDDAIVNARAVLKIDPDFPFASIWLGRALALSGRDRHLPDRLNEAETIFQSDTRGFGYLGWLYAVTGHRDEAEALAAEHPESPRGQMLIYGGLGDKERAFEALEKTADLNWWRAAEWMYRPELALLRGDPRLDAIKKRIGLPR
jgi:TolB-like protein